MTPYRATSGIGESAENARAFVRQYKSIFWDIFKPLIPYIAVLVLIDIAIAYMHFRENPDSNNDSTIFQIGGFIAVYFFSCLIISWHRVVLDGPNRYQPMNPLKPEKRDWVFIGMGLLIGLIVGLVIGIGAGIISIITGATGFKPLVLLIIPVVLYGFFLFLRLLFYFPSKATGNNLTLRHAYKLSQGYVWKLILGYILAIWRIVLVVIGYAILAFSSLGLLTGAAAVSGAEEHSMTSAVFFGSVLITLPITFYFQPLIAVIGVTLLSNFYQHALQNRPFPGDSGKVPETGPKEPGLEKAPDKAEVNHQDMNKARKALDKGK